MPAAGKPASIKDVASLAGVSTATVSRYLNNNGYIKEETRQQVAKAIAMLGYHPNPYARALVTDRTTRIVVFCGSITLYGQIHTLEGIEQCCAKNGYIFDVVVVSNESPGSIENSVKEALQQNPAGIILLDYDTPSDAAREFIPDGTPFVFVSGTPHVDGLCQVCPEEHSTGYQLTRHLIDLGHRSLCYVCFPGNAGPATRRGGSEDACRDARIPSPTLFHSSWDAQDARSIGRLIGEKRQWSAVIADNDELAIGVLRGLVDVGARVPEDISVVGFDDHTLAKLWNPALTTVRQDFNRVGQEAFSLLQAQINDEREGRGRTDNWDRYSIIRSEMIIRESTATPNEDFLTR
ncbi:LacI family transcriptional regulator [Bifidobacterium ramosum]|uniref:LacI family DNA-binding transcriptional regulator n=1 Tax=Bifidobacterium ramosum TaxID=1798158 RepID=A0A6L4WX03_9BIFI|nr:LacI family DNA-binding transcriptional regulator [Bifidobacterium ramosum]KAB8286600.1 LacI family transcriptional regulator [Bifidobacterium ramosum]NEG72859.1 LacI family DNA-binding transcriptional regulator [Bifidobacterium ramosum]